MRIVQLNKCLSLYMKGSSFKSISNDWVSKGRSYNVHVQGYILRNSVSSKWFMWTIEIIFPWAQLLPVEEYSHKQNTCSVCCPLTYRVFDNSHIRPYKGHDNIHFNFFVFFIKYLVFRGGLGFSWRICLSCQRPILDFQHMNNESRSFLSFWLWRCCVKHCIKWHETTLTPTFHMIRQSVTCVDWKEHVTLFLCTNLQP